MGTLADRRFEMTLRNRVLFGVGEIERLPEVVARGRRHAGLPRDRPGRPAIGGHRPRPRHPRARRRADRGRSPRWSPTPGPRSSSAARRRSARSAWTARSSCRSAAGRRWTPPRRSTFARPTTSAGLGPAVRRPGRCGPAGRSSRSRRPPGPAPRRTATASSPTRPPAGRGTSAIPSLLPAATILDPGADVGLPPAATAATGVDAMTHSLESLLSAQPEPVRRGDGARRHPDGRRRGCAARSPTATDLEARSQMLMASHLAGVGQASGTGVGLVHALGHAIGTRGRRRPRDGARRRPAGGAALLPRTARPRAGPRGIALGVASAAEMESTARRPSRSARSTSCCATSTSGRACDRSGSPMTTPSTGSSATPSTTPRSATRRGSRRRSRRARCWSRSRADREVWSGRYFAVARARIASIDSFATVVPK